MKKPFLLKKRGRVWYYRLSGETTFHTTGMTGKDRAARWARERAPRGVGGTLGAYCNLYYIWETCPHVKRLLSEKKSVHRRHVLNQRRHLERHILSDPIARIPLRELRRGHVLDLRARVQEMHTDDAANRAIGVLKTILNEAYFREDIDRNVTAGIGNIKIQHREKGILSVKELKSLLDPEKHPFPDERIRMAMLLVAHTGMRGQELRVLRWKNVDFDGRTLRIEEAWKGYQDGIGKPKSGEARKVGMSRSLQMQLRAYFMMVPTKAPDNFIICWDDGTSVCHSMPNHWLHRGLTKAGIDWKARNLTLHSLRHSIVTHARQAHIDTDLLRVNIGHASMAITDGYTQFEDKWIAGFGEAVDKLFE